jgi:hypothetical protein
LTTDCQQHCHSGLESFHGDAVNGEKEEEEEEGRKEGKRRMRTQNQLELASGRLRRIGRGCGEGIKGRKR